MVTYWTENLIGVCPCLTGKGSQLDIKKNSDCTDGVDVVNICRFLKLKKLLLATQVKPSKYDFLHALVLTGLFTVKDLVSIIRSVYQLSNTIARQHVLRFFKELKNNNIAVLFYEHKVSIKHGN